MVFFLMGRGRLITIEGIEGSGKSTQAALLADALRARGNSVMVTREPGGTRAGELIRAIFLDADLSLEATTELMLVLADRAQHVREKLQAALQAGQVVISDRYFDSTVAYQGYGRGLDLQVIHRLNRFVSNGVIPDLTILLDCPPEIALTRTKARSANAGRPGDRFEREQIEFHRRVRAGFRAIAQGEPSRVALLDSNRELTVVSSDILRLVTERVHL
jgi:dTMP kinase